MLLRYEVKLQATSHTYTRSDCVVFSKTKEGFGGLSNMAAGYPIRVNGIRILTAEALYQACRFPHLPNVQRLILGQTSPMTAKMKSKPYRRNSRPDWDQVRVNIMRWCLHVKLAQNWPKFSELLRATGDQPIVEESRKDDFWGAKSIDTQTLVGMNVLGQLLMELRTEVTIGTRAAFLCVDPLVIPDFLLNGRPIQPVVSEIAGDGEQAVRIPKWATPRAETESGTLQGSLFDQPSQADDNTPSNKSDSGTRKQEFALLNDLQPYPVMKNSDVPWLGLVPKHWEALPNRAIFDEEKERDRPEEQMLSVTITKGVIRQQALLADSSKKDSSNQDRSAYKFVRPGSIVYNKMRAWQGAVGASEYQGIVSPAYVVQRPRGIANSHYFHYLLRTPAFAKEAERWSYGITSDMWSLRPEHFKVIYSCIPPLPEQASIARFLDHADRRIKRYIGAKQKLIKLLKEQKQAMIHRAVTRGLDPNIRLKPSGVEWLGNVPEHWEVVRLGRLIELVTGFPFKSEGFTQDGRDVRLLRGVNISPGKIRWNDVVRWPQSERHVYSAFDLHVGDIVLGMDRPIIQSGTRVATISESDVPALLLQRVARIRPKDELRCDFLTLLLAGKSFADYLTPIFTGISVPHLGPEQIKSFRFALPADNEQLEIVRWTAVKTSKAGAAIESAEREIQLLREYRTRLIADVVTGKLDVRAAAAKLLDEPQEPEALDDTGSLAEGEEDTANEDLQVMPEEAEA